MVVFHFNNFGKSDGFLTLDIVMSIGVILLMLGSLGLLCSNLTNRVATRQALSNELVFAQNLLSKAAAGHSVSDPHLTKEIQGSFSKYTYRFDSKRGQNTYVLEVLTNAQ